MVLCTQDNGNMKARMDMGSFMKQMEIFTKDNGPMEKRRVKESTPTMSQVQ